MADTNFTIGPLGSPRAVETRQGGKGTPSGGRELPASRAEPAIDLSHVVERLNQYLQSSQRSIQFRIDEGKMIVTVVDANTGETVRQIPSEEMLAVSRRLREVGLVLDLYA